ncbi:uroporphyrinogen-III synthase [Isoptericola jiangsuensis]|uniref:uroporphyrinogen-III synthase n=1 Tax=Isoptericola jiangsuensis TaxID=548579 RepID=UPI003AAE8BE0
MSGPLDGRSILLPRAPARAAGLAALLRDAGGDVSVAPVIERAPAHDTATLTAAVRDVVAGRYAWTVITSVNAVDALSAARPDDLPIAVLGAAPTRWAAVGPATVRALATIDVTADLVPDDASAAGLVATFPAPTTAGGTGSGTTDVLLPLGDLATDTLRDGLAAAGWTPHVVTAYRTVTSALPPDVVARHHDLVVVTSGSVAREIAAQLGTDAPVVAIGAPSAAVARQVGLTVAAVAATPTDTALAAAVITALKEPS